MDESKRIWTLYKVREAMNKVLSTYESVFRDTYTDMNKNKVDFLDRFDDKMRVVDKMCDNFEMMIKEYLKDIYGKNKKCIDQNVNLCMSDLHENKARIASTWHFLIKNNK